MNCAACRHENPAASAFCEECGAGLERRCPSCASPCAPTAKFCRACGAALAANPAKATDEAVARKVVTIIFADLIGSTSLHERLDPESVSRVMDRYHRAVRAPVEAYGGTVVQLLGDGVLCAFGVPRVAEDDAIRAVRAAVGIQHAYREFARAERALIGDVGLRVAVNTGEVVVTDDYAAGIGDPLNVAARLQQEARDGDVLVSESTRRLVSELVTLERVGTFALKGRAESVTAYRVVSLERPAGASATPFVGREDELRRVMAVYDAAVANRRARLAVVLGSPGLGKSRLVGEVTRRLGDRAIVLTAQCDATGGGTFAPIAKALRARLGADGSTSGDALRAAIEGALPGDDAERSRLAGGIAALLGGTPSSPEETFFVVRRFLSALAATQPVVLAIDDLHWAEPLLLDLTEHLIQWSTDVPLLVLAAARPELRDARSALTVPGGLVTDVVTLAGLDAGAATRLAANVIGAGELPAAVAGRVLAASEGNPLFVGELVRMLVADGALKREGDRWTAGVEVARLEMPPTIQALLAARIERLRPEERAVLERASIVGRQFSRAAVTHLLPREAGDLDARLEALRRSELIEPDTGWYLGEPALRFHHVLIRDAAYRRLLKNTRAELHARFADWLEERVAGSVEHDETIGWHLEQAHQHLRELGPVDAQGQTLGERASRHLAAAGRRALARDDVSLAAGLLGRALDRLDSSDPARADLTLDWCEALLAAGDVGPAGPAIEELERFAADSPRLRAWHTCFAGQRAALTDPQTLRATADTVAAAADALAAANDAAGEAKAHSVHALALARLGRVGACEAALDRALAAARRADDRRRSNAVLASAPLAALWGPSPVTRASGRCLDVVRVLRITQGAPAVEAVALRCQGVLEALRGRSDAARRMLASSRRMVEELGITQRLLEVDVFAGLVDLLEGDAEAAERGLRAAYDGLRERGLGIDAAQAAALLGRALLALGRAEEAEAVSHESQALAGDDLKAAIAWRGVRAEALARRSEHAAAIDFARTAVDTAAATDALLDHADARLALARVLRAAGRHAEAAAEEARAIELWESKGATILVERARRDAGRAVDEARTRADRPLSKPPARVRANTATATLGRLDAAVAARDTDALANVFADEHETVHHPTGSVLDRQGILASYRGLLHAEHPTSRRELLATLGDSLALCRQVMSASGFAGAMFDVGAYERHELAVVQVDSNGRSRRSEFFTDDRLGDAIVRLYEWYADSLPDGLERARAAATALAVARLTQPPDAHSYEVIFAPDHEFVDHRRLGLGASRRAARLRRGFESLVEIADDLTVRYRNVLGLRSDALLAHQVTSGTVRASGGRFENAFFIVLGFGADGRVTRSEWFDDDCADQALARFEELAAGPSATVARFPATEHIARRVRPNAATANAARRDAAFAARDIDAIAALMADGVYGVHHPTGAPYDREQVLELCRLVLQARDLSHHLEPLASLGDSLALGRLVVSASGTATEPFDVGAFEADEIHLLEVDGRGCLGRFELFAENRLGAAVARLYERYAELLPDGPARTRAAATARSVAALPLAGPHDVDHFDAFGFCAPDFEYVDHRTVGMGSVHGAEALQRAVRALLDLMKDSIARTDDVLALRPDALLVRWTHAGTDRAGGGAFERRLCVLWIFGADGLVTRSEQFDGDCDAEALARFDQLTGGPPAAAPLRTAETTWRRLRANAATVTVARIDAAVAAGDRDALSTLLADRVECIYHTTGTVIGREQALETFGMMMELPGATSRHQPLATLGDSLALFRLSVSGPGLISAELDVGIYQWDALPLVELDAEGRSVRVEIFALDHLGDALVRLYEWYADALPDGPARTRAAATTRAAAALLVGAYDPDRQATACAPAIEVVDHRILGSWSARGADAFLQHLRSWLPIAGDIVIRVDDILDQRSDAILARWTIYGTDRASGGAWERPYLALQVFGVDGLVTRWEIFDADRDAEALARFDELVPSPVERLAATPRAVRRVRANAATANAARADAAIAARDVDAFLATWVEGAEVIDHPTGAVYGRQELGETWRRAFLRAPDLAYRSEELATLGERLGLFRPWVSASAAAGGKFDVGEYEVGSVTLNELDAQGRFRRSERFAVDRLGEAIVRLYERYAALLPDGAERARAAATARAAAAALGPYDLDRYATGFAPEIVYVDRRTLGLPPAHGAESVLQLLGSTLDLADDVTNRIDDVIALRSDALLVRWTNTGIDRAGGGAYERPFLWLGVFRADGLLTRIELFDADRANQALARFDVLTSAPPGPSAGAAARAAGGRCRVRPNAATANAAAIDAVIAARDPQALAQSDRLLSDGSEVVDHINGIVLDRRGSLASWRALMQVPDLTYRHEPLATLGDSLAVLRVVTSASGVRHGSFDVGAYEDERIFVVETDSIGRRSRAEAFHAHRLGDAIARLYAWHADLLPDGPARARAAATARSVVALLDEFNLDRIAGALDPEIEFLDHRTLGFEPTRGAEQLLTRLRTLETVATDVVLGIDDVLSLRSNGFLVRFTQRGTARDGGGTFETTFLLLWVFGPDGLATHQELFPSDGEAEALARFDELTGEIPETMPSPLLAQRNRRVRANAATENNALLAAAIAAREGDALPALFAEGAELVEHPTGAVYDRDGVLRGLRSLLTAREPRYVQEPLATLGDSLALCRFFVGASGLVGGKFDVGAYELNGSHVIEVDAQGRRLRNERFDVDHLGDAVVRLYERYAELLPDGPERTRAAATARSVAANMGSLDLDRMLSAVAPDADHHDHRSLIGVGLMRGVQGFRESLGALFEAADGIVNRVDEIFSVRPDAALLRVTNSGTDRRSGGIYERPFLLLWIFGADGLMTHAELFDVGHEDEALARFDELAATPCPAAPSRPAAPRKRRVRPNAATANAVRLDAAIAARDGDVLPSLLADEGEFMDHTTGATYEREGLLVTWRALLKARDPSSRHEPLATLGWSFALFRLTTSASGFVGRTFDVGAYEQEQLNAIEVDANGRRRWGEAFALDRLGDAVVRLYERYAESLPDGPARARAAATARAVAATHGPFDADRFAAAYAPDIEAVDHRILGTWFARGAEEYRQHGRSVLEVADNVVFSDDDVICLGPDALLTKRTHSGTDRGSGGPYENVFISLRVFGPDGRVSRTEFFDVDREAAALARFDALTAPPSPAPFPPAATPTRRVRPNGATANAARVDAAIAARDADVLPSLIADDAESIEHNSGVTYERQGILASWRILLNARDPSYRHEPLATLGDSLALCRLSISASGFTGRTFDVGAYEQQYFLTIEVDADGRRRRMEGFAADRLGNAVVRLYERHADLLAAGPLRACAAATSRSIAAYLGTLDCDRMMSVMASDVVYHDHRHMGFGSIRGIREFGDVVHGLFEAVDDCTNRVDDVLAMHPDAGLLRVTNFGTDRVSGGPYERPYLLMWVAGPDGLLVDLEQFDVGHEAEALARFDELAATPSPAAPSRPAATHKRRVRPNAATANAARVDAAIAARDGDVLPSLLADDGEFMDHTTGAAYEGQGILASWRALLKARDPSSRHEPLATLGRSFALFRVTTSASGFVGRTFDVGAYETDRLNAIEVDANGRRRWGEAFALDRLSDAVVRLYERFAEGLPDGPARARAATTARAVAANLGPLDLDRQASAWAPDVEAVDHRILGTWFARGAEAYRQQLGSVLEVADDVVSSEDDILGLGTDALLTRRTHSGTDRAGGGRYERVFIWLRAFGTDGLITRIEFFDSDREDEALARFDALTAQQEATRPVRAPSATVPQRARRVRPNAATANAARLDAVIAARDTDALPALFTEDAEFIERPTGGIYHRDGALFSLRSLLRARDPVYRHDPLATLGDVLSLCRVTLSATGIERGNYDVGAYETVHVEVSEVDAQGKRRWVEFLANDRLGDAVARLYERYAELLPAGPARDRAAGVARSVAAYTGPFDSDRFAAAWAPDIEVVDRRVLGTWFARGAEAFLEHYRGWLHLADDVAFHDDELLGLEPGALLWRRTFSGIDRLGGGAFERQFIQLWTFGADGRITRLEYFDAEREDEALARFDEVTAQPRATARIENGATRLLERFKEAWEARDWERLAAHFASEFRLSDRRAMAQLELDRAQHLASMRPVFEMTSSRFLSELLATRGERLALFRQRFEGSDRDVGPSDLDFLVLVESTERGDRSLGMVTFDPDELDAAYDELDARYLAGEAAPFRHAKGLAAFKRAFAARDWDAMTSLVACVLTDHRPLGWGTLDGPTYLQSLKALAELAPDTRFRTDHFWVCARGLMYVNVLHGTRDGGAFEEPRVHVFELDEQGRGRRQDFYTLEQLDEARARFAALRPDPLRIPPNAATGTNDRRSRAMETRDWAAFEALCAPTLEFDDRRKAALTTGGRDMFIASARLIGGARARKERTLLATAGDHLALEHVRWVEAEDRVPFEAEALSLTEVDAEGRVVAVVSFDPDDRRAASLELVERQARSAGGRASPLLEWRRGLIAGDLERIRAVLSDDFVYHDHRRSGPGRLETADGYLAWTRSLFEQCPDAISEPLCEIAHGSHGVLFISHAFGTLPEGGSFESVFVNLIRLERGRPVATEVYDLEDLDRARGRFEELHDEGTA